MTISSTTRKAGPFVGNGVAIAFPFTFKVFATTDIVVTKTVIATGVESTLVLTTDYTVSLNADQNANPGGTVNYNPSGSPMTSANEITVTSGVPQLQTLDLTNGGGFFPSAIANALDRAVILNQQLAEKVSRALVFPVSETPVPQLPSVIDRASKFLAFDTSGNPIAASTVTTFPVSAFMGTVLDDTTAAAAAVTLGVLPLAGGTMAGAIVFAAAQGSVTKQVFLASGTYTRPAGLRAALIMAKGAGASGAGTTVGGFGGGGGEGETGWRLVTAAQLGASQAITIGPGGAAIAANTNAGGLTGGTTSFGALLTALGGLGGAPGNNGCAGGPGANGGTGADWYERGARGEAGGDATGGIASINNGGGGRGAGALGAPGVANSGGGGGGGTIANPSGGGGSGIVVVYEFY